MKTERLKVILNKLRELTVELQVEIDSQPDNYTLNVPYDEVLQYIEKNNEGCWWV